ncbi:MAG: hypothetical protein H0X24_12250 [Ktedonobacterales bacterium]|nr:hypothetical protein [Ktedonobacterales bacterium]
MKAMTPQRRARYLARKKAHFIAQLRRKLDEVLHQDLAQFPPASRERLQRSIERMPPEIPAELVARIQQRLLEVAA